MAENVLLSLLVFALGMIAVALFTKTKVRGGPVTPIPVGDLPLIHCLPERTTAVKIIRRGKVLNDAKLYPSPVRAVYQAVTVLYEAGITEVNVAINAPDRLYLVPVNPTPDLPIITISVYPFA